jgi:hypothetical protein
MRSILVVALALTLFAGAVHAQSTRDRPAAGSFSLVFALPGFQKFGADNYPSMPWSDDTAGVFGGTSGIGLKYYISPSIAARIGVGFMRSSMTTKPPAGSQGGGVDEEETATVFTLAPGLQFGILDVGDVRGHAGFQFGFLTATFSTEGVGNVEGSSRKDTRWAVMAGGFLGAEWYFTDRLSLGAEYQLHYLLRSGKSRSTFSGTTNEHELDDEAWLNLKSASSLNLLISIGL